jgi:hypothetical protein
MVSPCLPWRKLLPLGGALAAGRAPAAGGAPAAARASLALAEGPAAAGAPGAGRAALASGGSSGRSEPSNGLEPFRRPLGGFGRAVESRQETLRTVARTWPAVGDRPRWAISPQRGPAEGKLSRAYTRRLAASRHCAAMACHREPARLETHLQATAGSQRHFSLVKVLRWAQPWPLIRRHLDPRREEREVLTETGNLAKKNSQENSADSKHSTGRRRPPRMSKVIIAEAVLRGFARLGRFWGKMQS